MNPRLAAGVIELAFATGSTAPTTPTAAASPAARGLIVAARALDAKGEPTSIGTTFDHAQVRTILVVVPVTGKPAGTEVSYVRYLNDKYIDSRTSSLKAPGRYLSFKAAAKAGKSLVPGRYRYDIFFDGKYSDLLELTIS